MSQERQNILAEFSGLLSSLTETVCHLAQQEEEKASAASERRHELLEGLIRQEQALLMKLKGLEQRRLELLKGLGWESLTFRSILSQAPEEEREILNPLFISLDREINRLRFSHEAANRILGARIHELQIFLSNTKGAESAGSFGEAGSLGFPPSRLQDKYV